MTAGEKVIGKLPCCNLSDERIGIIFIEGRIAIGSPLVGWLRGTVDDDVSVGSAVGGLAVNGHVADREGSVGGGLRPTTFSRGSAQTSLNIRASPNETQAQ